MKKTKRFEIRLTEEELEKIKNKASEANMNVSKYLITSALEKEIIVKDKLILQKLLRQLSGVGNNLNQVTLLAHQGKISCVELEGTKKQLALIYKAITGSKIKL